MGAARPPAPKPCPRSGAVICAISSRPEEGGGRAEPGPRQEQGSVSICLRRSAAGEAKVAPERGCPQATSAQEAGLARHLRLPQAGQGAAASLGTEDTMQIRDGCKH